MSLIFYQLDLFLKYFEIYFFKKYIKNKIFGIFNILDSCYTIHLIYSFKEAQQNSPLNKIKISLMPAILDRCAIISI